MPAAAYEGYKEDVRDPDPGVREALAGREDVPPEILYFLAQDSDVGVRRAVAANPATPAAANMMLTCDKDHSVRCEIAYKTVGDDGLGSDARRRMLSMGLTILETLATDQVVRVRVVLADKLKSLVEAPRAIIRMLAGDGAEEVASPILQNSPVLTDDDLMEILDNDPPEWAQSAIAGRETVSPRVAEAIAGSGGAAVKVVLVTNDGAAIAEPVLEKIVEEAVSEAALQEPLAQRRSMPPRLMKRLAKFVTGPVLALIKKRKDLSPEVSEVLVLRARTDVKESRAPAPAVAEAVEEDEEETSEADTSAEAVAKEQRAKAVALHRAGKLNIDAIAAAMDDGNDEFTKVALALKSGLSLHSVQYILAAKNAEVITAMVWKAGMSMRFAMDVQKFLARVPVRDVLNARGGVDYPLTPEKMVMLLDIFGD